MNNTWWVKESELDDDQKKVVRLGLDGSHLIVGPPGSGKTNSLVLRATYLGRAGRPNVLILVFTRPLKEFLASGASHYPFESDKIRTYSGWGQRLLFQYGVSFEPMEDFKANREHLLSTLLEFVDRNKYSNLYDTILLDEAHDYLPEEIDLFRRLGRNIFAVADSRQRIYNTNDPIDHLKSIVDETIPLRFHYRNGHRICELADEITKPSALYEPLKPTSNYDEFALPSSVQHIECPNISEQCEIAIKELNTQVKAYPEELLGIICPRRQELRQVREILSKSPLARLCVYQDSELGYAPFESDKPICVSTLHGSKGLEFRVLHILGCDKLRKFQLNRNMAFTGVTRAQTSLSIYHVERLPGYLEGALATLFPPKEVPTISDIFNSGD